MAVAILPPKVQQYSGLKPP